jgi:hypothetical protein
MLRSAIRNLLNLNEPPERTALAFAIGVFIGFSPFLGLQTLLAAAVSMICRLNKVATITGSLLNNPWTLAPIVALAWGLGRLLIGAEPIALPQVGISTLLTAAFWQTLASQWRQLLPFVVGSFALSSIGAAIAYPLMLSLLRSYGNKRVGMK